MRLKKQKRHRKAVRYYTACFGFRQPYKVLCDGTFVHHLLVNRIMPADDALSNLLGAMAKLFTSRCILAELKSMGSSYSESFAAASSLTIARCDHEKRKSAVDCIMEIIGEKNSEHFFVATQDTDLRKKFQEVPGVPLIFGQRNSLLVEKPSAFQRQFVNSSEKERLHMTELEKQMLKKRIKENLTTDEARDALDANKSLGDGTLGTQAVPMTNTTRRPGVKDKVQFKRKKAKLNFVSKRSRKKKESRRRIQAEQKKKKKTEHKKKEENRAEEEKKKEAQQFINFRKKKSRRSLKRASRSVPSPPKSAKKRRFSSLTAFRIAQDVLSASDIAQRFLSLKRRFSKLCPSPPGPNPLSCKKKSYKHPNHESKKEAEGSKRSRSRKRKRSHGGKQVAVADS